MTEISKFDKKVWENYVSNFEKSVLVPQNNFKSFTKRSNNKIDLKSNKSLNFSKQVRKNRLEPNLTLDLHGHNLCSAKSLLQKFISDCYEKNVRNILIITGKGQNNKGVLKEEVPRWLNEKFINKFLVNFNKAPKQFGGEGALLLRIKNKFKKINH